MRPRRLRPAVGIALFAGLVLAGVAFAVLVGNNGTFNVTITPASNIFHKDVISITYTPDTSKVNCSPIYLTQTCRDVDQNGVLIKPKEYANGVFEHMQDDMTPGGTYVDHVVCEKDPYYNGEDEGKDDKSAGSSDGHTAKPTTMTDSPAYPSRDFPPGVTKITSTFEVCAICKQDGRILDCVQWMYERTKWSWGWGAITAGPAVAGPPSQEFKDALAKYKSNHKNGTVCPETVAEINRTETNVTPGTNKKTPEDPPQPGQTFNVQWDIVNTSLNDASGVTWSAWLDGGFLVGGMVPSIPNLDFETVAFPVPPLSAGPHVLTLIADSDGLIPEYDETDNTQDDMFTVGGSTDVPPSPTRRVFGITAVQPNPARSRVAATVNLTGTGPAILELLDLSGRRVRELPPPGFAAGSHTVHLDLGRGLRPGMYLLRLRQGGQASVHKVTLVK